MNTSEGQNQGEFYPHHPGSEPLRSPKHKPGVKVRPEDDVPVFSAETHPIGTAPPDKTFQPNPIHEIPGQALNENVERSHGKESVRTTASSTLGGATSADVNKGLGRPLEGETSVEMRHDGEKHRKHEGSGLEGVGANQVGVEQDLRRLEREDHTPRGASATNRGIPAEDRDPASPSELAADLNQRHHHHHQQPHHVKR